MGGGEVQLIIPIAELSVATDYITKFQVPCLKPFQEQTRWLVPYTL